MYPENMTREDHAGYHWRGKLRLMSKAKPTLLPETEGCKQTFPELLGIYIFWCVWFLLIMYVGSIIFSTSYLIAAGVPDDPHWQPQMMGVVFAIVNRITIYLILGPTLLSGFSFVMAVVSRVKVRRRFGQFATLVLVTAPVEIYFFLTANPIILLLMARASRTRPSLSLLWGFKFISFFLYPLVCLVLVMWGYSQARKNMVEQPD